jgi:hypothetical protein
MICTCKMKYMHQSWVYHSWFSVTSRGGSTFEEAVKGHSSPDKYKIRNVCFILLTFKVYTERVCFAYGPSHTLYIFLCKHHNQKDNNRWHLNNIRICIKVCKRYLKRSLEFDKTKPINITNSFNRKITHFLYSTSLHEETLNRDQA